MDNIDLKLRLELAKISSCSCMTKTGIARYHAKICRYRAICEASDEIDRLRNIAQQVHDRLLRGDSDQELLAWLDQANIQQIMEIKHD